MAQFDPSAKHELYDTLAPAWWANEDFAEMHQHTLADGEYLDKWGGPGMPENNDQYDLRKQWSFALDLAPDLIDIRLANLFRTPPHRQYDQSPYKDTIARFIDDVDGGGTNMTDFMQAAIRGMYVNGVDIAVDKRQLINMPRSRADEAEARPYLQLFTPLDRLDWACDQTGSYHFARYDLGVAERADEIGGGEEQHNYITYTRGGWRRYTVIGRGEGQTTVTVEDRHGLGVVPVVPLYYRRSSKAGYAGVPLSLMTRLTPIARFMLQLLSQAQVDLYTTVAMFIATGIKPEDCPKMIGPTMFLAFPDATTEVTKAVLQIDHIAEKREWFNLCLHAMLRIGKMTGIRGELLGGAQSGVQVAIERGDLDSELAGIAFRAEATETRLVQLAISRQQGQLVPVEELGFHTEYEKRYVLTGVKELIEDAAAFQKIGNSDEVPTVMRALLRRVRDAVIKITDADFDTSETEITEAEFAGTALARIGEGAGGEEEEGRQIGMTEE